MSNASIIKEKAKTWLIGFGILAFLLLGAYGMFIKHSNEVGFLGMDKVGRQVFIQSFDAYLDPNIDVDSEFNDTPLPIRLIIGEPLRTTLKFDIRDEREFPATQEGVDNFLAKPASYIVDEYRDKITMQENYEVTPNDLKNTMKEKDVETVEDLLSGFGFKRLEMFSRGNLIKSVEFPRTKNVIHVGGD